MYQSLSVTLSSLPKPTLVYCGHEVNNTQVPIIEMKNIIENVLMTGLIILNDEGDCSRKLFSLFMHDFTWSNFEFN